MAIAVLTLSPMPESTSTISAFCLFCGSRGAIDALLNLLLFLPFGFGLRTAGVRRRWVIAASLATTLAIELLQVVVVPGRDASLGDVVWNTAGGALGALLAEWWRRLVAPTPRHARRLARLAAAGAFAALAAGSWMLRPSYPEGRWYAQWRPPDAQRVPPRAHVRSLEWNGLPIPNGALAQADTLRAASRAGGLAVETVLEPLEAKRYQVGVAAVADDSKRQIWRLGVSERAYRFWARMRGNDARFRTPGLLVPHSPDGRTPAAELAPAFRAGDTLRIRVRRTRDAYWMEVASRERTMELRHEIAPTHSAMLVLPMDFDPGVRSDPLTLAALVLLFAPLGYWSGFAARHRGARPELAALPLVTVVGSFWLLARLNGLATPPAAEWMAAFLSIAGFASIGATIAALRARSMQVQAADDPRTADHRRSHARPS